MPKVTVDTVTITKIGDSTSVLAGNKPHVFSDPQEAMRFAGQALGLPEPKPAYNPWDVVFLRAAEAAANPPIRTGMSNVDIVNAALSKLGEKGPLTPAGIAEKKRQEKNRKERERAAKKRKAAKRKK